MTMNNPSIVRKATPDDRAGIWELFDMVHEENAILSQSKPKINWLLDRILHPERIPDWDNGTRGFIGVIGEVGKLEGLILLCLGMLWYSDDIILEEYVNFVHPEHRNSNHAKTLISYARHLADNTGIPLMIGVVSNHRTAAKIRLYKRQLPEAGSYFLYNAHTGRPNGKGN